MGCLSTIPELLYSLLLVLHATKLLSVLPYSESQYFLVNLVQILTASFIEFMLTPLRVSACTAQCPPFSQGWLSHNFQSTFFFMDQKALAQKLGLKFFLQRLVLLSVLPAENFGVFSSLGFLHFAFCWI